MNLLSSRLSIVNAFGRRQAVPCQANFLEVDRPANLSASSRYRVEGLKCTQPKAAAKDRRSPAWATRRSEPRSRAGVGDRCCRGKARRSDRPDRPAGNLDAWLSIAPDATRVGAFAEPIEPPDSVAWRQVGKVRQGVHAVSCNAYLWRVAQSLVQ